MRALGRPLTWALRDALRQRRFVKIDKGGNLSPTDSATMRSRGRTGTVDSRLGSAIERARAALLAKQHVEGWWNFEDEANPTLDAQYIFLLHFTGLLSQPRWQAKAQQLLRWIRRTQRPDGTWAIHWDGPGCVSVTTECYTALKLMGEDPEAPHMIKAREFVRAAGGPVKARVLTKFQLAFLGELPWAACPSLPIQFLLAPRLTRFNIYELSYWARVCTVPLAVLADQKRSVPVPAGRGVSELFPGPVDSSSLYVGAEDAALISWKSFFVKVDKLLKATEGRNLLPFRKLALRRARSWILEHQDEAGDWGGIFPAIANSLLALFVMGMGVDEDPFQRGLAALERFEWPDAARDDTHIGPCVSPVWDTAWTVLALAESGLSPEARTVQTANRWLASRQILRPGDWALKAPGVPAGGWCFQFANDFYPDTDDSAVVMMALTNGGLSAAEREKVMSRGLDWLTGMQNDDGGWGAFERDVDEEVYNHIVYNDEKNMLDPSTVDVTGRLLEMFGLLGASREDPIVRRAEAYVRREQEPDGKWWGRWGVNYVYGTWSVLRGLRAIGVPTSDPALIKAADWLESQQQADGGWGESCASYLPGRAAEKCAPTASQTAWAVMALVCAGRAGGEACRRGVEWLLEQQRAHGLWEEQEFTGTGFPNAFYLRYHGYPQYFPLLALSAWRNATGE